jgi:hypothetical protein
MVLPLTVSASLVDAPCLDQLAHHRRHAAGAVIFLAEIEAGRLHVDQQRHVVADASPVVDRELHADVAGDGVDVDRRVGRAADRRIDDDAFSNALRVRMSDGFRSSQTISTMRLPVS